MKHEEFLLRSTRGWFPYDIVIILNNGRVVDDELINRLVDDPVVEFLDERRDMGKDSLHVQCCSMGQEFGNVNSFQAHLMKLLLAEPAPSMAPRMVCMKSYSNDQSYNALVKANRPLTEFDVDCLQRSPLVLGPEEGREWKFWVGRYKARIQVRPGDQMPTLADDEDVQAMAILGQGADII